MMYLYLLWKSTRSSRDLRLESVSLSSAREKNLVRNVLLTPHP
ncbi:MAG: hypothetical protein QXO64_04955 [Thermofilaceae archaeon]